jgi:Flp pilus assembly protein TadG
MLLFAKLLKRFHRDESGAFAVIFGVMAIVLIATGGSVVDFVAIQQNRATAQISMDAAVLALQPKIHTQTKAQIKETAEKLLNEGLDNPGVTITMLDPDIDKEEGRLLLQARISRPTFFVKFVGINKMEALVEAEATRARNRLEVAMVLDNSGSMAGTKITRLREAAVLAVDIISEYKDFPDKVFFGLVPFNDMIKVNPSYRNTKSWLDKDGRSSISWDNFDDDDDSTTGHDVTNASDRLSRFDLFDAMNNVSWAGCVEARPHNLSLPFEERLDVFDKAPTPSDGDSYIVPLFQPDTPDGSPYNYNYLNDSPASCPSAGSTGECEVTEWSGRVYSAGEYSEFDPDSGQPSMPPNTCDCDGKAITSSSSWWNYYYGDVTQKTCDLVGLGLRERQERICKYEGASPNQLGYNSPNGSCTVDQVIPLTNDMASIKTKINAMDALGGTNIHMGAMWGWRVLSPQEPFTEGVDYDKGASKVMILMTDGENTAYPSGDSFNNTNYYSMYGLHYNERMGDLSSTSWQIRTEMNKRTLQVCENAKAKDVDIEIYTIGLGVSSGSANGTMLTNCATDAGKAYFPADASELNDVFTAIADQLSDLRLSK